MFTFDFWVHDENFLYFFKTFVIPSYKSFLSCFDGEYILMSTNRETWIEKMVYCTSQTKYVSNEHGVSFHLSPLPSRFQSSRQFSSSPFSYRKLFGSPAFQFVNVIGRPLAIQKKFPSSAKSVPDVQKWSLPRPEKSKRLIKPFMLYSTAKNSHRSHEYVFLICRSLLAMKYWRGACRESGSIARLWTS